MRIIATAVFILLVFLFIGSLKNLLEENIRDDARARFEKYLLEEARKYEKF